MTVTFGDFYKRFGFDEYPFSVFTSENEQDKGEELFIDTSMYSPIIEGFASGATMLLAGDRGTGKTAIIYDFCRKANKETLIVNISDFSDLKEQFDTKDLYKFVIARFCEQLFKSIADDKKNGSALTHEQKILLTYFLAHFVKQTTKNELQRKIKALQTGLLWWFARSFYGLFRTPLNVGANATNTFLSNLISQSMGVANQDPKWAEYFPELTGDVDQTFSDPEFSFSMLVKAVQLAKAIGYSKITLIFDRIDEDNRLDNAADQIANFIQPLATDNRFLIDQEFQVVVSLWVIPFNLLKDKVRTQKIFCPSVNWNNADLVSACNRRISVYSKNKIEIFYNMFAGDVAETTLTELLVLCNKNPRDLWHLMDKVFRAQYAINCDVDKLTSEAITKGINDFVCQFNFYEYYPRKSNSKSNSMDIYGYIRHLLKLPDVEFTRNQLNEKAGTGSSTQNYVAAMESIGLVERTGTTSGNILYTIRDPKVVHALRRGLDITRSA